MTKIHETFYRSILDNLENFEKSPKRRNNSCIIKKKFQKKTNFSVDKNKLSKEISRYLKRYTLKDVVKLISEKNNLPKKIFMNYV